jgi:hypothetical protein
MATFPTLLKTGAVAQYPLSRAVSLATQSVRFLDGSQQTYQLTGAGLRSWIVSLDLLDESELSAVIAFADEIGTGTFTFTDPLTGETAAKCVVSGTQLETSLVNELHGMTMLGIEEVK